MARRSGRLSAVSNGIRSANSTPKAATPRSTANRKVGRPLKTTPQKSTYFKSKAAKADDDQVTDLSEPPSESSDEAEEGSGYDDEESEQDRSSESDQASEDDYSSDEKTKSRKRKPASQNATPASKRVKGGAELWKPGVKLDLEPGTQLVIKKPKARPAGDRPYQDDTIHPNTLLFLQDLAKNNDRQWLKMHDPDYRQSLQDFNAFLDCLTQKVVEIDETVPELPVKDIIFRIYRDVRFSKDPTPYKTHFSAAWSRTGRKGPYAHYYVQIKPGNSFVGGGIWQPEADHLARLRRDIDRKPHRIKAVLTDDRIRKNFFGGISKDDKKAVKAFASHNKESALKTKPKGFEADHKDIELLRLRNFTIGKKLPDRDILAPDVLATITNLLSAMVPFITHLNSVVMPDEDAASSSEDEEGTEEDSDEDSAQDAEE